MRAKADRRRKSDIQARVDDHHDRHVGLGKLVDADSRAIELLDRRLHRRGAFEHRFQSLQSAAFGGKLGQLGEPPGMRTGSAGESWNGAPGTEP